MGFVSFFGRVLFASVFLISAYQEIIEFGVDGGPASKLVAPKYSTLMNHVTSRLAVNVPEVEFSRGFEVFYLFSAVLLVLISWYVIPGSYLSPVMLVMIAYLALSTPLLFDFYNYDIQTPEFAELFVKFAQNLAIFGVILIYLGMKSSIPKRQVKRKAPKSKTA